MGTSQKSFDQVKSILGKLDRSIDQLRERRTGAALPRPAAAPALGFPALTKLAAGIGPDTLIGQGTASVAPIPAVAPAPAPSTSKWGRAQPIRGEQP